MKKLRFLARGSAFSLPGRSWELGVFVCLFCVEIRKGYGNFQHKLPSLFLQVPGQLDFEKTYQSSKTDKTEVPPLGSLCKSWGIDMWTNSASPGKTESWDFSSTHCLLIKVEELWWLLVQAAIFVLPWMTILCWFCHHCKTDKTVFLSGAPLEKLEL